MKIITIIVLILMVEFLFRPRLDYIEQGKLILWYGRDYRDYIILIQ